MCFIQPEFCVISSARKLIKEIHNKQPRHTPFPILNQSIVPYLVLTVASWPAYRFFRRQVRWSGIPSLEEFSTVYCDPQSQRPWVVNKANVGVFLIHYYLFINFRIYWGIIYKQNNSFFRHTILWIFTTIKLWAISITFIRKSPYGPLQSVLCLQSQAPLIRFSFL